MKNVRRVIAMVLASTMLLSTALTASAAGSPTTAPKNPGFDTKTRVETNVKDHHDNYVEAKQSKDCAKVTILTAGAERDKMKTDAARTLTLEYARNKNNKKAQITHLGDGTKGVFDRMRGYVVKTVKLQSKAKSFAIQKAAFKGSQVKKLIVRTNKLTIKKDAFKGTKVKNLKIVIGGSKKKASAFKFYKGCFNGLSSKSEIKVLSTAMSGAEFKLFKKKLKYAGFKGKVYRI